METKQDKGRPARKVLLIGGMSLLVVCPMLWQFSPIQGIWWEKGHLVFHLSDAIGEAMWAAHPELQDYAGSEDVMVHDTFFSIAGSTLFGYVLACGAMIACTVGYWKWRSRDQG